MLQGKPVVYIILRTVHCVASLIHIDFTFMDHPSSPFLINANSVLSANPPTPHLSLFGPDSEDESSDESIQEEPLGTITAPLSADVSTIEFYGINDSMSLI